MEERVKWVVAVIAVAAIVAVALIAADVLPRAIYGISLSFPGVGLSFGTDVGSIVLENPFKELPEQAVVFKDPANPFAYGNPFEGEERK